MKKCIRTAKEAAIKLVDLIFGDFKAEDKSGINSSFLCLFSSLCFFKSKSSVNM